MAVACAAADLLRNRALDVDVVMLLEGEEEAGSGGFMETVKKKKVREPYECMSGGLLGLEGHDWEGRCYSCQVTTRRSYG